ncbi:hypothetical protein ANN_01207 [Periplaneta americana]|uniref:Uncharacterized protein n=1 Tax=Periplaneta americana TaxID=6978 RepID=A0ABQ8TSX0_PERAM|nr:hypothetical protein ANN_01207 [Periplaneta americana]
MSVRHTLCIFSTPHAQWSGAPGCEPDLVLSSCDTQLEEEIVNAIYMLETLLEKVRTDRKYRSSHCPMVEEVITVLFHDNTPNAGRKRRLHPV